MTHVLFHISHRFSVCFVVRNRKIDDCLAEHASHAGLESFIGNRIFEIIHIAVGRCAAANHFRQAQTRADADKVFGDVLGFGRKNIFREPLLQVEVVSDAAKQSHRHVRVTVDEAGNHNLPAGVDDFTSRVTAVYFGSLANGNDSTALDRDSTIVYDST